MIRMSVLLATMLFSSLLSGRGDDASSPMGVQLDGPATVDQQTQLEDALVFFERAGLELPTAIVRFGQSTSACNDNLGLFKPGDVEAPDTITICIDLPFVATHELAHLWIHTNVDETTKEAFLEARGLSAWRSPHDPWNKRGTEDAAFVMQQILTLGEDARESDEWRSRVVGFKILTGDTSSPTVSVEDVLGRLVQTSPAPTAHPLGHTQAPASSSV